MEDEEVMAVTAKQERFDGVVYCHDCLWLPDVIIEEYLDYQVHLIMEKHSEETGHTVSCYSMDGLSRHSVGRLEE